MYQRLVWAQGLGLYVLPVMHVMTEVLLLQGNVTDVVRLVQAIHGMPVIYVVDVIHMVYEVHGVRVTLVVHLIHVVPVVHVMHMEHVRYALF